MFYSIIQCKDVQPFDIVICPCHLQMCCTAFIAILECVCPKDYKLDTPVREKDMYVFSVGIKLELMFRHLIIIDDLQ